MACLLFFPCVVLKAPYRWWGSLSRLSRCLYNASPLSVWFLAHATTTCLGMSMAGVRSSPSQLPPNLDPVSPLRSWPMEVGHKKSSGLFLNLFFYNLLSLSCNSTSDMGVGQPDDSRQIDASQQPALNTTRLVLQQLNQTDLVLHIGDISYARGYAGIVSRACIRPDIHLPFILFSLFLFIYMLFLCIPSSGTTSWLRSSQSQPGCPTWCALAITRETILTLGEWYIYYICMNTAKSINFICSVWYSVGHTLLSLSDFHITWQSSSLILWRWSVNPITSISLRKWAKTDL